MANLALADEGAGAGADLAELALARRFIGDRRPLELRPRLNKKEKPRIRYTPHSKSSLVSMGTGSSGRSTDEGDEVVGLVVGEEVRVEEGPAHAMKHMSVARFDDPTRIEIGGEMKQGERRGGGKIG